jgi:hypothetical protein
MLKITSTQQLKELCNDEEATEFFIALDGGMIRSSKSIYYNGETFGILNEIDGTEQELTEAELYTLSNIGDAIEKGALYKY